MLFNHDEQKVYQANEQLLFSVKTKMNHDR